jgi:hypothetical protein
MSFIFALVGVLTASAASEPPDHHLAAEAPYELDGQFPPVRIWVDEDRDLFYPGDRVEVRFRTSEDAYVAILHVDTEGVVDLLYPGSRWDEEFVYARRTYSLPLTGRGAFRSVSRAPGIGYFFIVASPYPLDLGVLYGGRGLHAIGGVGAGRMLRGDPFWILDQITRSLVRDGRYASYATDVYSYHVGGRHLYPSYSCYDSFSRLDSRSLYPSYTSCSDLRRFLGQHPHYYDTRRFRGDRTVYLRELDRLAPQHGFKERPDVPVRWTDPRLAPPEARGQGITPAAAARTDRADPLGSDRREPAQAVPSRQRPTLERRPEPRGAGQTPAPRPPQNPEPRSAPPRESVRPERSSGAPAPRPAPAREETQPERRGGGVTPARPVPREEARPERQAPGSGRSLRQEDATGANLA